MFYTYVFFIDDIPKYVGKGKGNRWMEHRRAKSQLGDALREEYKRSGKWLTPQIVYRGDEDSALAEEIHLIAFYGRLDLNSGSLWNLTDGGEGNSGHHHSDASRKLMSDLHSGSNNPFYGKTHSEETRKLLSELHRGHHRGLGKKLPEAHCRNISLGVSGDRNPACKVKVAEYPKIFALREFGLKQKEIGDIVGLTQSQISYILRNAKCLS